MLQRRARTAWQLANRQHGVVSRAQLLGLGFGPRDVDRRISSGRLHPVHAGVYAVGRPQLGRHGRWLAAVMACGPSALLSHESSAELRGIIEGEGVVHVSVPDSVARRRPGIRLHRRADLPRGELVHGIPVTPVALTLVDLASVLDRARIEAAVNAADKLDLIDPDALRAEIERVGRRPGIRRLRTLLDRLALVLTDTELERLFLPIARRAGLPVPVGQEKVNGFRVDFFFPELGLVVETDGLRYHRTPAQQARDRVRDQVHTAAGLTPLRFTHAQVKFEPGYVQAMLALVAKRLRAR